jgi:cytochrome c oxidase accessory protein FixG
MDNTDLYQDTEEFRDHISTVDERGKRIWLYPKKPKGRFYNARTWVSFAFLMVFFALPFIKYDGEPLLLFNVLERKFILFGLLFTPHDFYLFVLAMLTFLVFIVLFTVVFGRLFCGWVCPQTIFMEMIFRKIEYWIEGDANEQRRLNNGPWTSDKVIKKTAKHTIVFGLALLFTNFFLAYLVGMDEVLKIINEPISQHWGGFIAMLVFAFLFYGVFAFLREQVCTNICPYGRLQGVLLVKDSIVVAYDFVRGEPRGKLKKSANPVEKIQNAVASSDATTKIAHSENPIKLGDCIDCKLCVQVCPTGIDIRNGTQLECTNCTACIDACDEVMDKISRPRGLIRYDSLAGIESGRRKIFTPRVWAYSAVLFVLLVLDVALLGTRSDVETIILRAQGQLFQQVDSTHISNLYTYQIINKTNKDLPATLVLKSPAGNIRPVSQPLSQVGKAQMVEGVFFVDLDMSQLSGRKTPLVIEVRSGDRVLDVVKTNFMGPGGR